MSEEAQFIDIDAEAMDPRLRKQLAAAQKNLAKNPAYVIEVAGDVVARQPGNLEFRKLLFDARLRASAGKTGGFTKFMGTLTRTPFQLKGNAQLKKDPASALATAEKIIAKSPQDASGYRMLAEAATLLKMPQTAVICLEVAHQLVPGETEVTLDLGDALLAVGRAVDATKMADLVLREHEAQERAAELVRRAAVAMAIDKGYDKAESYRDLIADKAESEQLEEQSRAKKDDETLQRELDRHLATLSRQPDDVVLFRKIIDVLRALQRLPEAIEYAVKARKTPNGSGDPTLERLENDLREQVLSDELEAAKASLAGRMNDPAARQAFSNAKTALATFRLTSAESFVEKYPNDYLGRFRLGMLYAEAGRHDEAIAELQRAQRNPQVRIKAILATGKSMMAKGMNDLAIEQLENAKRDSPLMNDLKKEIIYELAQAHEQLGNRDKAITEYKVIYQADIGFRDVAAKINAFYTKV